MPSPTEELPSGIVRGAPLSERTYFRVGGKAAYLAEPSTLAGLAEALAFARERSLPVAVLGSGTNLVFSDDDFPGLVVSCARLSAWHWETPETLYVEAGVACTEIAGLCHAAGRDGAAWMFRLPGMLGAAVRMNARCFGGEISQVCTEVVSLDAHGRLHHRSGSDVFLGYKDTLFMRRPELVVAARLHFPETAERDTILAKMRQHETERLQKHHFDHPSCGSTFKNNYSLGVPSGRIFDDLGMRGTQVGGAQVSEHHANFIFNTGRATAHDILSLAALMRAKASTRGNLELEMEAVGSFPRELLEACGIPSREWQGRAWSGLFSLPEKDEEAPWPRRIFSSPFLEYWRTPQRGAPQVRVELLQHLSVDDARARPSERFLTWTTRVATRDAALFFVEPGEPPGTFVPELWHASVSEIFFARPGTAEYDEYELTPNLHWLAIALKGPRVRKEGHDRPGPRYWEGLERFRREHDGILEFGIHFPYTRLAHLLDPQPSPCSLALQACLSLGGEHYLLAPHWKDEALEPTWDTGRPAMSKPDFHQPLRFWRVPLG